MRVLVRRMHVILPLLFCLSAYAGLPVGTSLITDDGTQYQVADLSKEGSEIAQALKGDIESGKADNFIFYVHGRGKEPNKSLRDVIPDLEREYSAVVLMFHWFPSYKGPLGYPKEEAASAGLDLGKSLRYFQAYKESHKDEFQNVKTTMLVHSMGNIVLSKFMEAYEPGGLNKGLFDTVVLNSADVSANGHDRWVRKIDFAGGVYVTLNEGDSVLSASAKSQGEKRLGQQTTTITGKKMLLAGNVKYVDFSDTGVNHRYFVKSGQEDNPWLKQFYGSVMNGVPVDLEAFKGVKRVEAGNGNKIYVFKGD